MGLARPEDQPAVEAAAVEFVKLCDEKGFKNLTVIQTSIAVGAAVIIDEAGGDRTYAKELMERYIKSLESAVLSDL